MPTDPLTPERLPTDPAALVRHYVDSGSIAGAITLVADRKSTLDLAAVGMADIASQRVMSTDAMFWIASMTKPITGVLAMMLVDEGKLSLDDPIERHIPAFAGQQLIVERTADRDVLRTSPRSFTIRQAMSHTSGCAFFSRPEKTIDLFPLDQAVLSYALTPLLFEPGTRYQYGNIGINTVGRVIEILSGQTYDRFLRERLLEPLGMADTTFVLTDEQAARVATAYAVSPDKTRIVPTRTSQLAYPLTMPHRQPSPAGGLFSTATDCAKLGQMILNGGELNGHRFLSPAALRTMTGTQTGELNRHAGAGTGYGIGWETFGLETDRVPGSELPDRCGHGGALSTHLDVNPKTDRVSIFMIQQQGWLTPEAEQMRKQFNEAAGTIHGT